VDEPLDVVQPTSWAALGLVEALMTDRDLEGLPARGFATSRADFTTWADGRGGKRLLLEDFYRDARRRLEILMEGDRPVTGQWNYDADNRAAPPKTASLGVPEPWWPSEDEIDEQVRADLDRWRPTASSSSGGRAAALRRDPSRSAGRPEPFHRVPAADLRSLRGRDDDGDRWMSHSLLIRAAEPRAAGSSRGGAGGRGRVRPRGTHRSPRWRGSSARSSVGGTTSGTSTGISARTTAPATSSELVTRYTEAWFAGLDPGGHRGGLPEQCTDLRPGERVGAPHYPADGARQLCVASALGSRRADGLVSTGRSSTATTG
jgi:hypothetical protein